MDPEGENFTRFMKVALEEAKVSLREGNKGFGAVLAREGEIISKTHDTVVTDSDPTAHAEIKLVREASKNFGEDLTGYAVISTHEPCPMCTGALIWAKVSEIAYGASIEESMKQGRSMIDLGCKEIIKRSPWEVRVTDGILEQECSRLYDERVRKLIQVFRNARNLGWEGVRQSLIEKRTVWLDRSEESIRSELRGTDVEKAYQLLLMKIGIKEEEAPIVEESDEEIVFHSMNFCPALEACNILGLDTREICKEHSEGATDELIKRINPALKFSRNYENIRPHAGYCEERITLKPC